MSSRRPPTSRKLSTRALAGAAVAAVAIALLGAAPAPAAAAPTTNAMPTVVPTLQSWHGGAGQFTVPDKPTISAVGDAGSVGKQLVGDLSDVTGHAAKKVNRSNADIVLTVDPTMTDATGGDRFAQEGYKLDVAKDHVTISAPTTNGVFYGTRSLLQILTQSPSRNQAPIGSTIDWPSSAVRGFHLDVGRKYFTPQFIRDYITMMSWYKMNTFNIHLNDNEINPKDYATAYSAFRLKSDNPEFAGLAAKDGSYDRKTWDTFEQTAASHAMNIVPEIDTPAHAAAIIKWKPSIGVNGGNSEFLDLKNPDATKTMQDIFAEFMPWFTGPDVNFGGDEYNTNAYDSATKTQLYRQFWNDMAGFVRSQGKEPWGWGGYTSYGGSTEGYDTDVTTLCWYSGYYSLDSAEKDGIKKYININDGTFYIVPYADYYYGSGLPNQNLYNNWLPTSNGGNPDGAMFAVWNDMAPHMKYSEMDVQGMAGPSFPVLATKTWNANKPAMSYSAFTTAVAKIGYGPGVTELTSGQGKAVTGELSSGAPVTASTTDKGSDPAYLTDGQPSTAWTTKSTDPATVTIDLGAVNTVASVETEWSTAPAASYTVEVSDDGIFWQTVGTHQNATGVGQDDYSFPAQDARYVRLTNMTSATGNGLAAWRMSVMGTANAALNKTATASSNETSTMTPDMAVDGDVTTRWSATPSQANPWLAVDLGADATFSQVSLTWESSAKAYDIQVSNNGTDWNTIASKTDMAPIEGNRVDVVSVPQTTARYVRVLVQGKNSAYLSIWEFTVDTSRSAQLTVDAQVGRKVDASGWITKPAKLTLTADGTTPKTAKLQYAIGNGRWKTYTDPVTLTTDGVEQIRYRAIAGKLEADGHGSVPIDLTAPTTTITLSPKSGAGTTSKPVSVQLSPTDAASGVAKTEYRIDNGAWTPWTGQPIVIGTAGIHWVATRSTDAAGHVEVDHGAAVTIEDVTPPATDLKAKLSAKTVAAGDQDTLTVTGATKREPLTVTIDGTKVGSYKATNDGKLVRAITIPSDLTAGTHRLKVTGETRTRVDTVAFTVADTAPVTNLTVTVTPGSAAVTDSVHVAVTGATAGEAIDVTLDSTAIGSGPYTADASGNVALDFIVPQLDAGTYPIVATGEASGLTGTASLTVNEAPAPAPTQSASPSAPAGGPTAAAGNGGPTTAAGSNGGPLADTGSAVGALSVLAAAAVVGGAGVLFARRFSARGRA